MVGKLTFVVLLFSCCEAQLRVFHTWVTQAVTLSTLLLLLIPKSLILSCSIKITKPPLKGLLNIRPNGSFLLKDNPYLATGPSYGTLYKIRKSYHNKF